MSGPSAQDLLIRARVLNETHRPLQEIKTDLASTVGLIDAAEGATKAQAGEVMRLGKEYRTALGAAQALAKSQIDSAKAQVQQGKMLTTRVALPAALAIGYVIKKASDLNETINLGTHEFGKQAKAVEKWASSAANSMGLSSEAALKYAGGFNEVFLTTGASQGRAADMAKTLVHIGTDLASFYNTSTSQAEDAINSLLAGQSRPLRQYHKFATEAALKQQAIALGFKVTGKAMDPVVRQQAAYAFLLTHTTREQGDFARTSDQVANRLRVVQAQATNAAAAMGTSLLPVTSEILAAFGGFITVLEHVPSPIRGAILAGLGLAAIGPPLWYLIGRARLLNYELRQMSLNSLQAGQSMAGMVGGGGAAAMGATVSGEAIAAGGGLGALVARAGGWGRIGLGAAAFGGLTLAGTGLGHSGMGSALQSGLGLGMTGASIGTMISPGVGTAIGGGIGAVLGIGQSLLQHYSSGAHKAAGETDYLTKALKDQKKALKDNGIAVSSVTGQYTLMATKVKATKDELDARLGPKLDAITAGLKQHDALLDLRKKLRDPKATAADRTGAVVDVVSSTQALALAEQQAGLLAAGNTAAAKFVEDQLRTVASNAGPLVSAFLNKQIGDSSLFGTLDDLIGSEAAKSAKKAAKKAGGRRLKQLAPTWTQPGATAANSGQPVLGRGDTTHARAHGGSFARTLQLHAMADAMTPGQRHVTNAFVGNPFGDHPAGRALDLQGDHLNAYGDNLRRLGGWAEPHGQGDGRHLHAVYGDTAMPRAGGLLGGGAMGSDTFVFQIDARGSSMTGSEFRAIARQEVAAAYQSRAERRARPIGRT